MKKWFILIAVLLALGILYAQEVTPGLVSFNAGELSPLMLMRSDFQKYDNACQELRNMLVFSQGPAFRRPGLKYIADVNDSDDGARLIAFEYAKTDAYTLCFEDGILYFYREE